MSSLQSGILAVGVVTIAIVFVQLAARRMVIVHFRGQYGIYLVLLPVGFNCFGWGVPSLLVAVMVLAGLFMVLAGVEKRGSTQEAS